MRNLVKRIPSAAVVAVVAVLVFATVAFAASYSLFGDAQIVSPGNASPKAAELRSDDDPATYGGVDFDIPAGTTFADLGTLATDYMFTAGSCGTGSPRFQVNVEDPITGDDGNIFVYIGTPPNYSGCAQNVWTNTGDLLEGANPIDTSQLDLGTFYDPYATALTKYGSYVVTGVQLVVDAGYAFPGTGQTVQVDNVNIDGTVYAFDQPVTANDCKNGGWQFLTRADDSTFKNQGDCIQYVNTGK